MVNGIRPGRLNMKISRRLFWLTSLLFFLGGCSGYKTVCTPETGMDTGFAADSGLEEGDQVRVHLVTGESVTGEVVSVSDQVLVVVDPSDKRDPRNLPIADIHSVESGDSYTKWRAAGLVLALGLIVVAGSIILDNMQETAAIPSEYYIR
jgi:hypothetical protein